VSQSRRNAHIDKRGTIGSLLGLAVLIGLFELTQAEEPVPSNPSPFFIDATRSHLPTHDLRGFSMDAAFVDVEGDGDLDIVIANEFRPNLLLLNNGGGKFGNESRRRLPQVDHDFDADGDSDIVIVSEDDQVNEFYLNDGNGFFSSAGDRLPVRGISNAVISADFDEDGDPDILIGNNGQNVALVNDGLGFFREETHRRLPSRRDVTQDLEMGDVDGDGDLDLLVANEDANRLLLNNGHGFFKDSSAGRLPIRKRAEETREVDLGDVDGDGDLDIFFANVRLFLGEADPQNRLLINNGRGFFSDETAWRLPRDRDLSMDGDFFDVDQDGDLDIITANFDDIHGRRFNAAYRVYLNDGQGEFRDRTTLVFPPGVTGNGLDIEAGDVDQDGREDLYLCSRGGPDRLLIGVRQGRKPPETSP
jgi:hypothetical protein